MNIVGHCRLLEQSILAAVHTPNKALSRKGVITVVPERKRTHTYYKCAEYAPHGVFYRESISADFL